jgi:hypothetical protein
MIAFGIYSIIRDWCGMVVALGMQEEIEILAVHL